MATGSGFIGLEAIPQAAQATLRLADSVDNPNDWPSTEGSQLAVTVIHHPSDAERNLRYQLKHQEAKRVDAEQCVPCLQRFFFLVGVRFFCSVRCIFVVIHVWMKREIRR